MGNLTTYHNSKLSSIIPPSGDVLCLKSDTGVTLSLGTVSAWADQSGNGNNFAQGVNTKRPTLVDNVQNGYPGLLFDCSDDFLTAGDKLDVGLNSWTVMAVIKGVSTVSTMRVIISKMTAVGSNAAGEWGLYWNDAATSQIITRLSNNTLTGGRLLITNTASPITTKTWGFEVDRSGANQVMNQYINGDIVSSASISLTPPNLNNTLNTIIGSVSGGVTAFYKGYVMEIRIYPFILGSTNMATLNAYFKNRYQHY